MNWLNEKLRLKVKQVFEPRYKRLLSDCEVEEIAYNLVSFVENVSKFRCDNQYEKRI